MKIKKIPFPNVTDVLCAKIWERSLRCDVSDYEFNITVEQEGHNIIYCISMFHCGMWICDSVTTAVRDSMSPEQYNPLIRKWYKLACEDMQKIFEEQIIKKYLEEE